MSDNQTLNSILFEILLETGMRDTTYNPSESKYLFAAGGIWNGQARIGKTFNQYAAAINGSLGSAGLFSNVQDMSTYMQMMLNKGQPKSGGRVFTEKVIDEFTKRFVFTKYKNSRALGWDTVPSTNPPCGTKFSANSFGLSDVGGSYIWADKDKGVAIVFLANGNYPFAKPDINKWQGTLSNAIMTTLGY